MIARSRTLPNTWILPVFADNGYPDIIWEIDRNSEKEIYIERERGRKRERQRGSKRERRRINRKRKQERKSEED